MKKRQPQKHAYHLLDMRSPEFGYSGGWLDRDDLMLIASFTLLKDFVEKEEPFKYHFRKDGKIPLRKECVCADEYKALCRSRRVGHELWLLYQWWIKHRVKQHADFNKLRSKLDRTLEGGSIVYPTAQLNAWVKIQRELRDIDQKMLHRLIDIRSALWT